MRYKLTAFVCDEHCIKWINNEGTLEYTEIFSQRPHECRFAILEADNQFICVDMFETEMDQDLNIIMPKSLQFLSLDAAVMAAQMKL